MSDSIKGIFKFVIQELLWCLDETKDIYTSRMREHLSDELIEELLEEVNEEYEINLAYGAEIEDMDVFQFCEYVNKNIEQKREED